MQGFRHGFEFFLLPFEQHVFELLQTDILAAPELHRQLHQDLPTPVIVKFTTNHCTKKVEQNTTEYNNCVRFKLFWYKMVIQLKPEPGEVPPVKPFHCQRFLEEKVQR